MLNLSCLIFFLFKTQTEDAGVCWVEQADLYIASLNLLRRFDFHHTHCFIYGIHSHTSKYTLHLPGGDRLVSKTLAEVYSKFYSISLGNRSNSLASSLSPFPHLQNKDHETVTFCKMPHCRSHELNIIFFRCPLS